MIRRARMEEYPTSALAYAVAARVALHRGNSARCQELLTRAQRLRPRLTYALPYFAVQTRLELARAYLTLADAGGAATMLREIDAISAPPAGPRSAPGRGGPAARQPDDAAHARSGGLDPDRGGAPPPALPRHAPLLPRDRRAPVPLSPHREVPRHGDLPQAQRGVPQRRGRPRPRARAALGAPVLGRLMPSGR